MSNKITLITLTQGNPIALRRTIDNVIDRFQGKVDQVVIGSLCVFMEDVKIINEYIDSKAYEFSVTKVDINFNSLFIHGFGTMLNELSRYSSNDLCLYMNVSEIVDSPVNLSIIHPQWNCYKFDHATEQHKWIRLWNRTQLQWSGRIHEEVIGTRYTSPDILFTMADTPKDTGDDFYSWVMDDCKEAVYFNQYLKLIDSPSEIGATDQGWVRYAKENYQHIKDRLLGKGKRYEAFVNGDLNAYLASAKEDWPNSEAFKNSNLIHFQNVQ